MDPKTVRELQEIDRANDSGRVPVVFVHGLWLLASSWDRWRDMFEENGYITVAPDWPDDPETVEDAHRHPEAFANKRLGQIAHHYAEVVRRLEVAPVLIGHSFGGLIAQMLAGLGLSTTTVAIDPAPFRGVLSLPFASLRSAFPVLHNPANWTRSVTLTFEQFRYGWANCLDERQAQDLYDRYLVPGAGAPLFQTAAANVNPNTEARVDVHHPGRGPLLIISGQEDHTVPPSMCQAAYRRQQHNECITELAKIPNRGHSLTIDDGWREVAVPSIGFVLHHRPPERVVREQPQPGA
jgi:non-heme chloroperoxidase